MKLSRRRSRARAEFIVLGVTSRFVRFDVLNDAGQVIGQEFRRQVIVRDTQGITRRAYRRESAQ
jgi:hypothetical protein